MDDVVAPPAPEQMGKDAEPEQKRGQDSPSPVRLQLHPWPDGDDFHSRDARILSALPLTQRQVRHFVAVLGEPLRQVPVPAFGAPDGMRIEAVVDEANAHEVLRVAYRACNSMSRTR